jgi:hypothetical protein
MIPWAKGLLGERKADLRDRHSTDSLAPKAVILSPSLGTLK